MTTYATRKNNQLLWAQSLPTKRVEEDPSDVEKLVYPWDSTMTEWFVIAATGLEHGFTLSSRPDPTLAAQDLVYVHLGLRGNLTARVSVDGRRVSFLDPRGVTALNYSGLKVSDADGRELSARFTREPRGLRLEVNARHARYPITINPIAQQAYLKPAQFGTTRAGDGFGYSVAISGGTIVVGAPREDSASLGVNSTPDELAAGSSGAAYVFVRNAGAGTRQAYLKPAAVGPGGQAGDHFGWPVAISGDTVAVGAPDEAGSTTGVNSTPIDGATNAGAVYVFTRSGGVWSQQAYVKTTSTRTTDEFGASVAISGDTIMAEPTLGHWLLSPSVSVAISGDTIMAVERRHSPPTFAFVSVAISGDTIVAGRMTKPAPPPGSTAAPIPAHLVPAPPTSFFALEACGPSKRILRPLRWERPSKMTTLATR